MTLHRYEMMSLLVSIVASATILHRQLESEAYQPSDDEADRLLRVANDADDELGDFTKELEEVKP